MIMGRATSVSMNGVGASGLPELQNPRIAMRGFFFALALSALLLTGWGCSSGLTLTGIDDQNKLSQSFANCYATATSTGDWDVVLVNDPTALAAAPARGPLQPAHLEPRQIVHLRIFWKAPAGINTDQVAASNAAVEWFLVGNDPSSQDLIEYAGTAFVSIDQSGSTSKVVVNAANLRPVVCRGRMHDLLGPSKLTGSVVATVDPTQVKQILDEEQRLLQPIALSAPAGARPVGATALP